MRLPAPATKRGILTLTTARADTRRPIPGVVQLRLFPRLVPAALLRELVTKLPLILTATIVPADISLQVVRPLRLKPAQPQKSAPAVKNPEPATSARLKPVPIHVFILYALVQPTVIVRAAR